MPIIAPMKESTVLQPRSPVPISSSEDARITGESIQKAGAGLENFGAGLVDFFKSADKANKENLLKAYEEKAKTAFLLMKENTLTSDSSPDGSTMVPSFMKGANEQIKEWQKEVDDDDVKAQIANIGAHYMNQNLTDIVTHPKNGSMQRRLEYGHNLIEQVVNDKAAYIRMNPESFDSEFLDLSRHLDTQAKYLGPNKEIMSNVAVNQFAKQSIAGYVERGQYDLARKLVTEKYGQYLDAEKGEIEQTHAEIDKAQYQAAQQAHQMEEWKRTEAKRRLEDIQDASALNYQKQMNATKTPAERMRVENLGREMVAQGVLRQGDLVFTNTQGEKVTKDSTNRLASYYTNEIYTSDNLRRVRKHIVQSFNTRALDSTDYERLLGLLEGEKKHRLSDPNRTLRVQEAKQAINLMFGTDEAIAIFPAEEQARARKLKESALRQWTDLVTLQNRDPFEALETVKKDLLPKRDNAPMVPRADLNYNDQFNPKRLKEAKKRITQEYKEDMRKPPSQRRYTSAQFLQIMNAIDTRVPLLKEEIE